MKILYVIVVLKNGEMPTSVFTVFADYFAEEIEKKTPL